MQLAEHKRYFETFANKHKLALVSLLLPSFIVGWQSGKRMGLRQWLSQLARLGFSSVLSSLRKLSVGI